MKNPPGYPLPAGELGSDDIVCQLVYLPDRPEYWQAFYAALHYMTTWRAWERDDDKRGKDAAANWRAAFELTSECWRMACLEQLQDDVAAILAIMEIPQACCDAGDVTDGDQYTDRVEDGEGDVPQPIIDAGYADDSEDWAGFDDYKCMISHVIIDQLEARLNEIAPLVQTTGGILGGVAALAGILAVIFATGGLAIVFGIVAGIGATSLLYAAITDFGLVETLAAKVATNHDELACAVYRSDGDVQGLAFLNTKIDELFTTAEALILKNMNLGPTLKMLYAGRYDQQDIAEILFDAGYELGDFSCDCDQIGEYLDFSDFETDLDGWRAEQGAVRSGGIGVDGGVCMALPTGSSGEINHTTITLAQRVGETPEVGDSILLHRIKFRYSFNNCNTHNMRLRLRHDSGTEQYFYECRESWGTEEEIIFSPPLESTFNTELVEFMGYVGNDQYALVDRVYLDFDYVKG